MIEVEVIKEGDQVQIDKDQEKKQKNKKPPKRRLQKITQFGINRDFLEVAEAMRSTISTREYIAVSESGIVIYSYDTPLSQIAQKGLPAIILK